MFVTYKCAFCDSGDELRRGRSSKRDDPRRHTLSGDQHHNYQPSLTRSMDLEVSNSYIFMLSFEVTLFVTHIVIY